MQRAPAPARLAARAADVQSHNAGVHSVMPLGKICMLVPQPRVGQGGAPEATADKAACVQM